MVNGMGFVNSQVGSVLCSYHTSRSGQKISRAPIWYQKLNKSRSWFVVGGTTKKQEFGSLPWIHCCVKEEKNKDSPSEGQKEEASRTSQEGAESASNGNNNNNNRAPTFSLPTIEGTVEPRLSLFPPQSTVSEEERLARIREISNMPEGTWELEWKKVEQLSQFYEETHPWPSFLRATVYERYDRFEQAVDEMNESIMRGLNLPDPLERRASILLRMGRWKEAVESFDEAVVLNIYGLGNELSSLHNIREEIEPYLPEWSGPPLNVQRAAAYYFMERYDDARECVAIDGLLDRQTTEGALWSLAIKAKSTSKAAAIAEASEDWVKPKKEENDTLGKLWQLYTTEADRDVSALEKELEKGQLSFDPSLRVVVAFYMGLYFDSFYSDTQRRDKWWKEACEVKSEKKHFWQWVAEAKLAANVA